MKQTGASGKVAKQRNKRSFSSPLASLSLSATAPAHMHLTIRIISTDCRGCRGAAAKGFCYTYYTTAGPHCVCGPGARRGARERRFKNWFLPSCACGSSCVSPPLVTSYTYTLYLYYPPILSHRRLSHFQLVLLVFYFIVTAFKHTL